MTQDDSKFTVQFEFGSHLLHCIVTNDSQMTTDIYDFQMTQDDSKFTVQFEFGSHLLHCIVTNDSQMTTDIQYDSQMTPR